MAKKWIWRYFGSLRIKSQWIRKYRPNHFKGVVDVISRFIYLIKPRCIFLGKKDFQQLIIVKDFVDRNKFKVKVVGCKTVREKNGIAISSRNLLLSKKDITIASKIYKLIKAQKKNITKNKKNINLLKKSITKMGIKKVEYLTSININKHISYLKWQISISKYIVLCIFNVFNT